MGSIDKDDSRVEVIAMTPFNNQVNSSSNFDFQSEMKANAFPGKRLDISNALLMVREATNDSGMTGLLGLKRELVGKDAVQHHAEPIRRGRSRSNRRRKGRLII
jgi:hypothetical protein